MRIETRSLSLAVHILVALALAAAPLRPTETGLSPIGSQWFGNETFDNNVPTPGDHFGYSLATGDFNGDGVADLATGIPFDDGPEDQLLIDAGAVQVRMGVAAEGLGPATTWLSLYAAGGPAQAAVSDYFGHALAAGDFNGDGRTDLAVGAYGDDANDGGDQGSVFIYFGGPSGLPVVADQIWRAGVGGVPSVGSPIGEEQFGFALAAGDFNADLYADLAIGAPQTCCGDSGNGGAVVVLHGGSGGLTAQDSFLIRQGVDGVPDADEWPDNFGFALAAGNFNGDLVCILQVCWPYDDLAISAPGEDGIGAVMVFLGSPNSLLFGTAVYLGRGDLGGPPGLEFDEFGWTLATGNFDGDLFTDLAISAPYDDLGPSESIVDAGFVTVVYGSASGLNAGRLNQLTQGLMYDLAEDEPNDHFGYTLAAGDFNRDGRDELAIGHPGEDYPGPNRGGVTVLRGGSAGLTLAHDFFLAGLGGVPPGAQDNSDFAAALAVGDFDGGSAEDLAVGIPYRDLLGVGDVGAESILYGVLFADGFELGSTARWSATVP